MSWGAWGKQFSIREQADMIQFCVENGNTTFDHADIYGDYTTEQGFGNALIESKIPREEIQLVSKCGIQLVGNTRTNKVKHYNYSKDYIVWSAEESLKKLNTDYLDVFLLHRPSPLMQPDEIAQAITLLKDSGKILQFGVSNFTPSQVDLISERVEVLVNQIEFSITHHNAMLNGSLDHAIRNNIHAMSWSPLGSVFKNDNEQSSRIKAVLNTFCEKYGISEAAVLLCWILKHPANVSPVIGTTNKSRIKNANKALEMSLELEDWFTLLHASKGHEIP